MKLKTIPLDMPIIDAIDVDGIVLGNGVQLSYEDLGRILTELGSANLLRSTIIKDRLSADHAAQTFKESGRIFNLIRS